MARAMWKGVISFGLVNIPVELFSSTEAHGVQFHMLSQDGSCRLRRKLYCPETGEEYDFNETARGVEIAPDQYILVQSEELDAIKPDGGRTIQIEDFVKLEEIDPIYYDRTYYLAPEEGGEKAYSLLVAAMSEKQRVGVARFVMRNKEYLAAIRVMDDGRTIALETMNYHQDIRSRDELNIPETDVSKKELDLAKQLVDTFSSKFKPEKYTNEYDQRVEELIEAKAKGKEVVAPEGTKSKAATVVDLMEVLKKSISEKKKGGPRSKSKVTSRKKQSSGKQGRKQKKAA